MDIAYFKLVPSLKVNVLAAGHKRTILFHDDEIIKEFHENIIPVAEKSRLMENYQRDGEVFDALILTEHTYLVGYGYISDDIDPQEAVKQIEEENINKLIVDEQQKTATIVLYFQEKMTRH